MVESRYIVNTFVQMFVSTFESLGVLVCAVGGRIDLSPSSSREIGASGEGGLRRDDADDADDVDDADDADDADDYDGDDDDNVTFTFLSSNYVENCLCPKWLLRESVSQ